MYKELWQQPSRTPVPVTVFSNTMHCVARRSLAWPRRLASAKSSSFFLLDSGARSYRLFLLSLFLFSLLFFSSANAPTSLAPPPFSSLLSSLSLVLSSQPYQRPRVSTSTFYRRMPPVEYLSAANPARRYSSLTIPRDISRSLIFVTFHLSIPVASRRCRDVLVLDAL